METVRVKTEWFRMVIPSYSTTASDEMAIGERYMTRDHWIAIGIRTAITLTSVMATMYLSPAGAQTTTISGSGGNPARQTDSAQPVSGPTEHRNAFYLRAGVGLDQLSKTRFRDEDCFSTSPAALYGCGRGNDGTGLSSSGDFGTAAGIEVGVGFLATPKLRLETSIAYRPRFAFEGRANFIQTSVRQSVSADLWSMSSMVAAYMDLSAYGPFRLFAGSGAGLHYIDINNFRMTFPSTETVVPDGRNIDLTVMLTAGVATSLSDKITLDLAWRYVDRGIVETGRATGQVVWKDGRREPLEIDLAETRAMLKGQGFRASLRYAF